VAPYVSTLLRVGLHTVPPECMSVSSMALGDVAQASIFGLLTVVKLEPMNPKSYARVQADF
jgi:hypothetical protein